MAPVDLSKLVPIDQIEGDDEEETRDFKALVEGAESFVGSFRWAGNVLQAYAGPLVPGVIGVFLFRIDPADPDVDEWLWVIVGDIPPAYLVLDQAPDAAAALQVYVDAMDEWVQAATRGEPVEDLIPVNVEANPQNARMLAPRLQFLRDRVIAELNDPN